jgi:hypothetical protein
MSLQLKLKVFFNSKVTFLGSFVCTQQPSIGGLVFWTATISIVIPG